MIVMANCKFSFCRTKKWSLTFALRTLSSSTLDALKEFYAERDAHTQKFAKLQAAAEERATSTGAEQAEPLSMDLFTEDWNESQFWVRHGTLLSRGTLPWVPVVWYLLI